MQSDSRSLSRFFLICYLIPIVTTGCVYLAYGSPVGPVTAHFNFPVLIVTMAMVHAPTIAAVIVMSGESGLRGIRALFRPLKRWDFDRRWYCYALLAFPLSIMAAQSVLIWHSQVYAPAFTVEVIVLAALIGSLWEEIGWTGFATPRLLKRRSPLSAAVGLGVIHLFWHLTADYWGAIDYFGDLRPYLMHVLLWLVGLIVLRVMIVWMYVETQSVVLGWLTHFSYTGGQLFLVSLSIPATETLRWNAAFVIVLLIALWLLYLTNDSFRNFWTSKTSAHSRDQHRSRAGSG